MFDRHEAQKGQRSQLAKHLGCQTGLVSQVINGERHFSLEQMVEIANFYQLGPSERDFLMLMAQSEKAGSESLRSYYQEQLEKLRLGRQRVIAEPGKQISQADFGLYHSKWYNHALHVLIELIPKPDIMKLSDILKVSEAKVNEALHFLVSIGALTETDGHYKSVEINNSAERGSPWVDGIHQDFRLEAIKSLDHRSVGDSHYSRFFVAGPKKNALIQEELAELMKRMNELIASPDEQENERELHGLCFDCFSYNSQD